MKRHRGGPPAGDHAPEAARRELDAVDREIGTLRGELDRRLAALEAAIARPDSRSKLEELVIALARVATAEAQTAATRAALATRVEAEETNAAALADLQTRLEAERANGDAIRRTLEETQAALDAARAEAARAQQERDHERDSTAHLRAQVQDLGASHVNAYVEAERRLHQLEAMVQRQSDERAALEAELARERETAVQERDTAARLWDTVSTLRHELATARQASEGARQAAAERDADRETHRNELESLDRRVAELDAAHRDAVARLSDVTTDRDALRAALDEARREAAEAREALGAATAANATEQRRLESERAAAVERMESERTSVVERLESELASAVERLEAAERRTSEISAERDTLASRLESAEANRAASEQSSAEATRVLDERLRALDAERARLEEERRAAVARSESADAQLADARSALEAAERARAADQASFEARLAALDASRRGGKADAKSVRLLKAAVERIRVLEFQLAERQGAPGEDIDLDGAANTDAPVLEQAGQRARRFTFRSNTKIQIDNEQVQLVDLSLTGVQFIGRISPEVGRIVPVALPSDVAPCFGQGRLLWARREPTPSGRPQRYRVGLVFTDVDQSSVDAFIKNHATQDAD